MLDPEIGKNPLCAPLDSVYNQKNSYQESMVEEEVQIKDNEEAHRDLGYIEGWLQTIFKERKHFLFQQFLASHERNKLAFHIQVYVKVSIATLNENSVMVLLCTWLHWKFSYT